MPKYRVPRVNIGPYTNEIIVEIARSHHVKDEISDVTMTLKRRACGDQDEFEFETYTICDNKAHFQIPEEFLAEGVPAGFYDATVKVDGCEITSIEVIKAPSRHVTSARSVESNCSTNSDWNEPECIEDTGCQDCGSLDEQCNSCGHNEKVVTTHNINPEYIGD